MQAGEEKEESCRRKVAEAGRELPISWGPAALKKVQEGW